MKRKGLMFQLLNEDAQIENRYNLIVSQRN